jgi:hypothetical protein
MIVEQQAFATFYEWVINNAAQFGIVVAAAIVLGVFFGYIVATLRHGPFEAFYVVAQVVGQALPDFINTSPRRVFAIARLAIKEALRRKIILVTFGIFAISLLFGGWFMNYKSDHPDRIYINFVMFGTQLLVLMMGMLISSFSLPEDIKNKTIYTVVTKPVRPTEIVIGKIVGFGILGTFLLVLMGSISYLFVWRGLSHDHLIAGDTQTLASFTEVGSDFRSQVTGERVSESAIRDAETNMKDDHNHRLELRVDIRDPDEPEPLQTSNIIETIELPDGRIEYHRVVCVSSAGHVHQVFVEGQGQDATISLGPSVGFFRARVPIYADELQFYDRQGQINEKGISVGRESRYRGYVDGGDYRNRSNLSKAEFTFTNFDASLFSATAEGETGFVPLELTLDVFRSYKGDIEKRVTAGIQFESIGQDVRFVSDMQDFETEEFSIQTVTIPRKLVGKVYSQDGSLLREGKFDLFDDYAKNGQLKLVLKCRDYNQYLGVAKADVYFRSGDHPYLLNFIKGYTGIWCQMMIIISLGVALSTFLSAPITMLGALVVIIIGFFSNFIQGMTAPDHVGGGPIESMIRVVTQQNMVLEMDTGVTTTLVKNIDLGLIYLLNATTYLAPDFSRLNFAEYLTYGYAINSQKVAIALTLTLAFCFGLTIVGYFALKTREIAK